jgi:rubredoxin
LLQKLDELFSFQVQRSMSNPNPATPIAATDPSNPVIPPVADPLRDRHECNTCGYVYLPLQGDERQGVAPRTAFDDLPEKWRCPVCSASQRRFQNLGPAGSIGFKQNAKYGLGVNTLDPGKKNLLIFGSLFVFFLLFLSLYGLS